MLEKIKARLEAISTRGPWTADEGNEAYVVSSPEGPITWDDHGGEVFNRADAEFIAHAPEDQLALLITVEDVLRLHMPEPESSLSLPLCDECLRPYPCPTVQVFEKNLG